MNKLRELYYGCMDYGMPTIVVILIVVLTVLVGVGLGFVIMLGVAWVTMLVYNVLAEAMGWPMFSVWFWFGVWTVIGWVKKGIVRVKIGK